MAQSCHGMFATSQTLHREPTDGAYTFTLMEHMHEASTCVPQTNNVCPAWWKQFRNQLHVCILPPNGKERRLSDLVVQISGIKYVKFKTSDFLRSTAIVVSSYRLQRNYHRSYLTENSISIIPFPSNTSSRSDKRTRRIQKNGVTVLHVVLGRSTTSNKSCAISCNTSSSVASQLTT